MTKFRFDLPSTREERYLAFLAATYEEFQAHPGEWGKVPDCSAFYSTFDRPLSVPYPDAYLQKQKGMEVVNRKEHGHWARFTVTRKRMKIPSFRLMIGAAIALGYIVLVVVMFYVR